MEFWGVEVKSGVPLSVVPGEEMLVHISLAALGEKKNNGNEPVRLYLKYGDQKLVIGTLSHDKFPHLRTEIVLETRFELSHDWKNGSVFFSGYKSCLTDSEDDDMTDGDEQVVASVSIAFVFSVLLLKVSVLPLLFGKLDMMPPEKKVTAEVESDEDDSSDSDEEDSSDDGTPEKAEESKKRSAEANTSKKTASNKKAKFVTPQKTETKTPHVHIATPHPSKQAGKNSGSNGEASKQQQQTPKSAGAFGCKSCNRTFTSEMGLQSHTKAKHSAAA
ncbi:unnamed protein product [Thlaspi arvense]|uniref:C2H2-type domain-containing protein n=1 Tax=Thlaspi arvense TaxID=13288 RepID=A0AAU9SWC1_THLAR|nr:unnamed protein product [Thlaspi arvense]